MAKRSKGRIEEFIEEHQDKVNFAIAIILLLLVVFIFSILKIYFQVQNQETVAKVNGEPIYASQLDYRMENMPLRMQRSYTREMVLDQLIQEELLDQRVEELGLEATDEEMAAAREDFMEKNALDEDSLKQVLQAQGASEADLGKALEEQVLLNKLLEMEAFAGVNVSREEARDYYEENAEQFVIPAMAEVKQALVTTQNRSDRKARLLAKKLLAADEELCEAADEYLDRRESSCGEYNVSRFSGLPDEFINKSFDMEIGDADVIKTSMGYHAMEKLGESQERVISFDTVYPDVKKTLLNAKQKRAYRSYVKMLRQEATIENYLLDEVIRNVTESMKTDEEVERCVAENATLYGARWDKQTQRQKAMLGNVSLRYVECSLQDTLDEQRQVCEEANIQAYPTWRINGEERMEVLTFEQVAKLAGCS